MTGRTKSVTVDVRPSESGSITGYASTFTREPDWVGDVVAKGAFAGCLQRMAESGTVLPLLYNHDQSLDSFIGRVTDIREDEHGLLFSADFDNTASAQRARQLAMDGRLAKFSFAYAILDQATVTLDDGRKANELRELDIDEVSLVLSPCNPDTSVVDVKASPNDTTQAIDQPDGLDDDGDSGTTEGGEGDATPEGREDELKAAVAYAKAILDALEV